MSTAANFFIEVKRHGKWELLEAFYPFEEREISEYNHKEEKWEKKLSTPDLVCNDGRKLSRAHKLWRQGTVRDLFSRSYFNHAGLNDRGFPEDMSEDAKAYFDAQNKKLEEEKKDYFERTGQEKTWCSKWWWGESYMTMGELEKVLDERIDEWRNDLRKAIDKKLKNSILVKKNDELYNMINNVLVSVGGKGKKERSVKTDPDEVEDSDERIDYLLEEEIYDLMQLESFRATVDDIVEMLTDDFESIRLIVWCS